MTTPDKPRAGVFKCGRNHSHSGRPGRDACDWRLARREEMKREAAATPAAAAAATNSAPASKRET